MENIPSDCIQVMSEFFSAEDAHSYIQTSKNGYNDIKDSMPLYKKKYYEEKIEKIEKILESITLDTTPIIEYNKIEKYMDFIKNHYTEWLDNHNLSVVAESYKEHFIDNNIHFTRMNKNYSFVAYIIMALCH